MELIDVYVPVNASIGMMMIIIVDNLIQQCEGHHLKVIIDFNCTASDIDRNHFNQSLPVAQGGDGYNLLNRMNFVMFGGTIQDNTPGHI